MDALCLFRFLRMPLPDPPGGTTPPCRNTASPVKNSSGYAPQVFRDETELNCRAITDHGDLWLRQFKAI